MPFGAHSVFEKFIGEACTDSLQNRHYILDNYLKHAKVVGQCLNVGVHFHYACV